MSRLNDQFSGQAADWHLVDRDSAWILLASPLIAAGVLGLSTFYVTALTRLWRSPRWRPLVKPLAAVGRMALTSYLAQSVAYVVVLYGLGLGLLGTIGPALGTLLALVIFGVQVAVCNWWLRRFPQGPAEALWRRLTYGRPF